MSDQIDPDATRRAYVPTNLFTPDISSLPYLAGHPRNDGDEEERRRLSPTACTEREHWESATDVRGNLRLLLQSFFDQHHEAEPTYSASSALNFCGRYEMVKPEG